MHEFVRARTALFAVALLAAAAPAFAGAASLTPTHAGLLRQSLGARDAGFTYLQNDGDVHDYVRKGLLVTLRGNDDYYIHPDVRVTAARPEVKAFVERLGKQYRAACDEKLVVTSLVRPRNRQPWNSDPLSVHPTGMAVDLRVSSTPACRRWLEKTLLDLEGDGLIEAARERVVPHYHVVVFPAYAQRLESKGIDLPASSGIVLAGLPPLTTAAGRLPAPMMPIAAAAALTQHATPAVARTTPAAARSTARRPTTTAAKHTASRRGSATTRRGSTTARRGSTTARHASVRRYKVRNGDNLWSIARKHGISVQAIRRANKVASARLKPGQVLAIPAR